MWCCGTDILKGDGKYRKSVFDKKQIDALKGKFNYVSGNQKYITRQTFKKNIGYLGIRAVSSFLDRIFNSFDIDGDNKISFQDFIQYMEILKDGTDDQKAQISFNLIYMQQNQSQIKNQRKNSFNRSNTQHTFLNFGNKHDKNETSQLKNQNKTKNQNTFHLKRDTSYQQKKNKKKKVIDMTMFEKFFEDFYKSWSSITNESIPTQTKNLLKQFIKQLFRKIQADGRTNIDIQYYKMLYKDRQFMMAFRQINSKLGNFFIKSNNNEYQKNVTLFHKILKKIINLNEKVFPLLNKSFLDDIQKPQFKYNAQSPSYQKRPENQTQDLFNDQNIDKYFYDAKRYQFSNIFQGEQQKKQAKQTIQRQDFKFQNKQTKQTKQTKSFLPQKFMKSFSIFTNSKQKSQSPLQNITKQQSTAAYQSKLQDHVAFLQKKLLYLQNVMKQIIDETKQIYNEMHQEFIKIFDRIQKQQHQKQSQMREYSQDRFYKNHDSPQKSNQSISPKNKKQTKSRKDDKKVFFGDKNFNLVLQIMVGIQMSVRSVSGFQQVIFQQPQDFNLKHTFQMDYGHFGQNDVLYTFTDYAPNVFNHIRKIYGIQNQHYISSIGPNRMMSALIMGKMASFQELVSEGKSGSFFYHTEDGKYLIKTISQRQFYLMRKILQEYYKHLKLNPQTLMPRIFGLHKISQSVKKLTKKDNKMTFYLIVMNNFFNTKDKFIDKYDLKGSWVGRQNNTGKGVKKDLNFIRDGRQIDIDYDKKVQLYNIIEKDVQFFARNEIIDYSMLLGFVQSQETKKLRVSRTYSLFQKANYYSYEGEQSKKPAPHILDQKNSMNFKFTSQSKSPQSYLFGIIDILTEYNSRKHLQNIMKSCIYDSKGISAVEPLQYKNRFLDFMKYQVFKIQKRTRQKSPFDKFTKIKSKQELNQKSRSKSKKYNEARSHDEEIKYNFISERVMHENNKKNIKQSNK